MDGTTTAYIYDMSPDDPLAHDDILLEFDASAAPAILTRRWAHSGNVDEPLGFEGYNASGGAGTGTERAIFADRQGSVIWVTEPATGDVIAAYEYDGYGQITQTQGTLVQPYGYTGREYDAESGLYYYRARNYDPATGVFLQSDPIGFGGGQLGVYSYVENNPLLGSDPSGLLTATEGQVIMGMSGLVLVALATPNENGETLLSSTVGLAMAIGERISAALNVESTDNTSASPNGHDPCSGYRANIVEHQEKLLRYLRDPLSMDNKGHLANAPDALIQISMMLGRINKLVKAIHIHERLLRKCEKENGLR